MSRWVGANGNPVVSQRKFGILGILNLTGDSFYPLSRLADRQAVLARAQEYLAQGADVLDLGAESTRPGADDIDAEKELARIEDAISAIKTAHPCAVISVDTRKASVALRALELGAQIINDVSACRYDQALIDILSQYKPAYILMHSKGSPKNMQNCPEYANVLDEVMSFFDKSLAWLTSNGLPENRIALDVGIGFGKNLCHNLALLANMDKFLVFNRPLVAALSMKSMFGQLLGLEVGQRASPTATASAMLWERGIKWHRVHDVSLARQSLLLAESLHDAAESAHDAM